MSPEQESEEPIYQVEDSDGLVARERKKMIMRSRKAVNEASIELFLGGSEGIQADTLTAYHHIVRQFLRNIEVLLANPDIKGATEAYEHTFLGRITVTPPVDPGTSSKPDHLQNDPTPEWAQNADSGIVLHRFSDPVEPQTFKIIGLKEIIKRQGKSASWEITVDRKKSDSYNGAGPEEISVSDFERWNINILNNAIRTADQFLDNANIGFALTEGEPDDGFLDL